MERDPTQARAQIDRLTPREREAMKLRAQGLTNLDAALQMGVSVDTVKKHLSSVYEKLEIDESTTQYERTTTLQSFLALLDDTAPVSSADHSGSPVFQSQAVQVEAEPGHESYPVDPTGVVYSSIQPDLSHQVDALAGDLRRIKSQLERLLDHTHPSHAGTVNEPTSGRLTLGRRTLPLWFTLAACAGIGVVSGVLGAVLALSIWSTYYMVPQAAWTFSPPTAETLGFTTPGTPSDPQFPNDSDNPNEGEAAPGQIVSAAGTTDDSSQRAENDAEDEAGPTASEPGALSQTFEDSGVPEDDSVCGESAPWGENQGFMLNRADGVLQYTVESTEGMLPSNRIRTLLIDEQGLWLGLFGDDAGREGGVVHYNRRHWIRCPLPSGNLDVNHITRDTNGDLWVALAQHGLAQFDHNQRAWISHSFQNGLTSDITYQVLPVAGGRIFAQTWEGVALYNRQHWRTPYSRQNDTLHNNRVHTLRFDSRNNIWAGHVDAGISYLHNDTGQWQHWTTDNSGLGGNHIRDILTRVIAQTPDETAVAQEEIWIATEDGGVSRFLDGEWSVFRTEEGLPGNKVIGLALDRFNRVWVATDGGVAYLHDSYVWGSATTQRETETETQDSATQSNLNWTVYHRLPAHAVAFGIDCDGCPFDGEQVWTATQDAGITYSRLPPPDSVINVLAVNHPQVVAPGERFHPEIVIAPRAPYQFRQDRGDALYFAMSEDERRFNAWPHIPARAIVEPGEPYTFVDYDNPMIAPELPPGVDAQTFTSVWRMWWHTRYVGPPIVIEFTVRQPEPDATPTSP